MNKLKLFQLRTNKTNIESFIDFESEKQRTTKKIWTKFENINQLTDSKQRRINEEDGEEGAAVRRWPWQHQSLLVHGGNMSSSSCCVILAATETKKNNAAATNGAAAMATMTEKMKLDQTRTNSK